jgi:hypothetical protein
MPLFKRWSLVASLVFLMLACDSPGAHLVGQVFYEGTDAQGRRPLPVYPAYLDTQLYGCFDNAFGATGVEAARFVGQGPTHAEPPIYIGLWPVATASRSESHGKADAISIGVPRPGDNPFLKKVICNKGEFEFDWKTGQQLEGRYYIGAWLDLDFNGFPGEDEPFGVYVGDDGSDAFADDGSGAVAITFEDGVVRTVRIRMGTQPANLTQQLEAMRAALEEALIESDETLFLSQFQPLFYKDAFNRNYNELGELWNAVTEAVFPASNDLQWEDTANDATRVRKLILKQNKDPLKWDLAQQVEHRIEVAVPEGHDGINQIVDWKPLSVQSGLPRLFGAPAVEFAEASELTVPVSLNAATTDIWFGLEEFVPAVSSPTGGTWRLVDTAVAAGNPRVCTLATVGTNMDHTLKITSLGANHNCDIHTVRHSGEVAGLDAGKVLRATVLPWGAAADGYEWPEWQTQATEPTRGNFLRVYFYGSNYHYRSEVK